MRQPTIQETILFMMSAHRRQRDKSGVSYWQHPYRVMLRLAGIRSEIVSQAALLHDVVEDTDLGLEDLTDLGYSQSVLEVVSIVSHDKTGRDRGRSHQQWIEWIRNSGNLAAVLVKYADLLDNHAPGRIATLPPEHRGLAARQERAIATLRPVIPAEYLAVIPAGDLDIDDSVIQSRVA